MRGEPFVQAIRDIAEKQGVPYRVVLEGAGMVEHHPKHFSNIMSGTAKFLPANVDALCKKFPALKKVKRPALADPAHSERCRKSARKKMAKAAKSGEAKAETKFRKAKMKGPPKVATPQRHRDRIGRAVGTIMAIRADPAATQKVLELVHAAQDLDGGLQDLESWLTS